jgi:hypothetical protein
MTDLEEKDTDEHSKDLPHAWSEHQQDFFQTQHCGAQQEIGGVF